MIVPTRRMPEPWSQGCGGERDRELVSPRIIRMMDAIFYDRKTERRPAPEVTSYTGAAPRSGSDI